MMDKTIDYKFLRILRTMSTIEGISTLVLFAIAMPLKYLAEMPLAVTICGSIHGLLFMLLVGCLFTALDRVPIPLWLMIAGIIGAIFPFGPFVVDIWFRQIARTEDLT